MKFFESTSPLKETDADKQPPLASAVDYVEKEGCLVLNLKDRAAYMYVRDYLKCLHFLSSDPEMKIPHFTYSENLDTLTINVLPTNITKTLEDFMNLNAISSSLFTKIQKYIAQQTSNNPTQLTSDLESRQEEQTHLLANRI